jgi:ATP-binding cassette subfamily F protein uup
LASGGSLTAAQFLQRFLFDPDKQYTYIHKLSGGERRRLHLLSILFRNPNFLILDEPTNDLDLPTLSVLEQFLVDFPGCLMIVSHDRYFMDRLVDHLFVFEGDGEIRDFPGNYAEYRLSERKVEKVEKVERVEKVEKVEQIEIVEKKKQLSFKEKRELESLEKEIPQLQKEKVTLTGQMSNSDLPYAELEKITNRFTEINQLLEQKEWRWLELSE